MSLRLAYFRNVVKLKSLFSTGRRQSRMERFLETMDLKGGERVIDLGGTARFWKDCPLPLSVTIVNLPGSGLREDIDSRHEFVFVEGDACDLHFVSDNQFDIAFSNSVIEHVGGPEKQAALAREVRRVAPRYWVQTPSIWFPIEAHNFMPFWWFYPPIVKRYFLGRWRRKLPAWSEMVATTTVILRRDLIGMFPGCKIWTERFLGFSKSYIVYR